MQVLNQIQLCDAIFYSNSPLERNLNYVRTSSGAVLLTVTVPIKFIGDIREVEFLINCLSFHFMWGIKLALIAIIRRQTGTLKRLRRKILSSQNKSSLRIAI